MLAWILLEFFLPRVEQPRFLLLSRGLPPSAALVILDPVSLGSDVPDLRVRHFDLP